MAGYNFLQLLRIIQMHMNKYIQSAYRQTQPHANIEARANTKYGRTHVLHYAWTLLFFYQFPFKLYE